MLWKNKKQKKKVTNGAIFERGDAVRLHPNIPHYKDLNVLRNQYDQFNDKTVRTKGKIKMAKFMLQNKLL